MHLHLMLIWQQTSQLTFPNSYANYGTQLKCRCPQLPWKQSPWDRLINKLHLANHEWRKGVIFAHNFFVVLFSF